jgi:hypothetical protein
MFLSGAIRSDGCREGGVIWCDELGEEAATGLGDCLQSILSTRW